MDDDDERVVLDSKGRRVKVYSGENWPGVKRKSGGAKKGKAAASDEESESSAASDEDDANDPDYVDEDADTDQQTSAKAKSKVCGVLLTLSATFTLQVKVTDRYFVITLLCPTIRRSQYR